MKAKIIKVIPKVTGFKKGKIYQVDRIADDKEGVWLIDDNKNNVFVLFKNVELLQEDGLNKFENGSTVVAFSGLLPKSVEYDGASLKMTVIW